MIEFVETGNKVRVKLDGKIVGEICSIGGGWQYFPTGRKTGGEIFKTLHECKNSLAEE